MRTAKRILLLIFLISLGIVIAIVVRDTINMKTEALLVAILFLPLLAYALLSGSLRELGFGGLTAKFGEVANETVQAESGEIGPSLADLQEVGQKGFMAIEHMLASYRLSEASPIVMIIKLGRGDYPRKETLAFIDNLSRYGSFKFVVFLTASDELLAYMPSWAARQLLSRPELGNEFLSIVNRDGNYVELFNYPHILRVTDTISEKDSNLEALRKMAEHNLNAMLVVDSKERLKGVIERDRVIGKALLKILER